jgi:PBP1b-binding outer membrane lipoprotein LpoB
MFRLIIVSTLLVFMVGCSREAPLEDVDKAGALFFQRLNDAEYDTIYKDASTQFKKNQPRDTVVESLKELTAKGRLQEFRRISTSFTTQDKDRIATPVFGTTFEQTRGEITLSFIDEGGEWKLIAFSFKQRA